MKREGLVVVVSGCSGSGKTTLAEAVAVRFVRGTSVSLDAFYRPDLGRDESWESPQSIAWDALLAEVQRRAAAYRLVVLEGFCVLSDARVAALADLVVRLECPRDEALQRRVARDGGDAARCAEYFAASVWPAHLEYARATAAVAAHVTADARAPLATNVALVARAVEEKMG